MSVGLKDQPRLVINVPKATHQWIDGIFESRADIGGQHGNGVCGAVPDYICCHFLAEDLSVVSIPCVNVELINPYGRHWDIGIHILVCRIKSYSWNLCVDCILICRLRYNRVGQPVLAAGVIGANEFRELEHRCGRILVIGVVGGSV